jgi:hypothetical protein
MQKPAPSWDLSQMNPAVDVTTKIAVLYLFVSVVTLIISSLRFLPTLIRFRAATKSLSANFASATSSIATENDAVKKSSAVLQTASARMQSATIDLRKWSQLTLLVMLTFTANEFRNVFDGISVSKTVGPHMPCESMRPRQRVATDCHTRTDVAHLPSHATPPASSLPKIKKYLRAATLP